VYCRVTVVPTATGCKSSPTRYTMADIDENVADGFDDSTKRRPTLLECHAIG